MNYFDSRKEPFLDALDKTIIKAVKYKQFMTSKEVWANVKKELPDSSPGLIHHRLNHLVELGILGCIEQDIGNAVVRRFYCFQENSDYSSRKNDFSSFLENDKI